MKYTPTKKEKKIKQPKTVKKTIKLGALYKQAWIDFATFYKPLVGITAVFGIIYFIFAAKFSLFPSLEDIQDSLSVYVGDSVSGAISSTTLIGVSITNISNANSTLLQLLLFLLASTAIVWAMRKHRGLKKTSVLQAYYEGPANIVPLLLVCVMLLLTLIPASIAATVLSSGLPLASTTVELLVMYSIAIVLVGLSVYFWLIWWPAFYISMLPGARPIASMRVAAQLTKYQRAKVFRRSLFVWVSIVLTFFVVVFPIALIAQRLVPFIVYVVVLLLFCWMHVIFFTLYRSMVDDADKPTAKN
ncbi:MAG: hypothetical protein QG562_521 [Patescibacteria group bacterium]|nr:hypothetical protein [Patescibacteria group bacterium]MDQ5958702.1 hypothetical protein [Patescibacteria group bacterium]